MRPSEYPEYENPESYCSMLLRTLLGIYLTTTTDFVRDKDGMEDIQLLRDYIERLDDDLKDFSAEEFMIWFSLKTGKDPKEMIRELWRTLRRRKMGQQNYWTMGWSPENCILNQIFPYDKFVGDRRIK